MTKSDLIKKIEEIAPHLSIRGYAKKAVTIFFDEIKDTLSEGGRVELRGLGAFWIKERKARKARNPKNGESVYVEPKKVIAFKMGKQLKEVLNKKAA